MTALIDMLLFLGLLSALFGLLDLDRAARDWMDS